MSDDEDEDKGERLCHNPKYALKPGTRWTKEVWNGRNKFYNFSWNGRILACDCPSWRFSKVDNSQRTCIHTRWNYPDYDPVADNPLIKVKPPKLPLFAPYDDHEIDGWYWSWKRDGVRAFFDGNQLISRSGQVYNVPSDLLASLPRQKLDGELVGPTFEDTLLAIQGSPESEAWNVMSYQVFDSPEWPDEPFSERYQRLLELKDSGDYGFHVVVQHRVRSVDAMRERLEKLTAQGYEGIVLRHPDALYRPGRNAKTGLKWKLAQHGEADVTELDKDKCVIRVVTPRSARGKTLNMHLACHESVRVGDRVAYTYRGLTGSGKPRFARLDL